jgi:hypothetical protein
VFRGVLDGLPVAVKLLDPAAAGAGGQQGPKEFAAEVAILSRLHHPHIVLLIGSCPERCGLVYELMEGGSLEQHLFSPRMPQLCWQVRWGLVVCMRGLRAWQRDRPTLSTPAPLLLRVRCCRTACASRLRWRQRSASCTARQSPSSIWTSSQVGHHCL